MDFLESQINSLKQQEEAIRNQRQELEAKLRTRKVTEYLTDIEAHMEQYFRGFPEAPKI